MYISITGIKVRGFFGMLKFLRYTMPSFAAARKKWKENFKEI
jgi:hypothetical protein